MPHRSNNSVDGDGYSPSGSNNKNSDFFNKMWIVKHIFKRETLECSNMRDVLPDLVSVVQFKKG